MIYIPSLRQVMESKSHSRVRTFVPGTSKRSSVSSCCFSTQSSSIIGGVATVNNMPSCFHVSPDSGVPGQSRAETAAESEPASPSSSTSSSSPTPGILDRIRSIFTNSPSQRTLATAYKLEQVLGSGRFGVVWRATDLETGREVAVKTIRKVNVKDEDALTREVEILSMVQRKRDIEFIHMMMQHDTMSLGTPSDMSARELEAPGGVPVVSGTPLASTSSPTAAIDHGQGNNDESHQHSVNPQHQQQELGRLMNLIEAFEDREHVHIVSELYTGGELFDRIVDRGAHQYRESHAANIFLQILLSLKALHDRGITHRDLKPENICFVDDSPNSPVVLVDFGHACRFDRPARWGRTGPRTVQGPGGSTYLTDPTGSILYVAPEVLDAKYTEAADLWSAGVILFVLLTGAPPFNHETQSGIEAQIRQGVYGQDPDDGWHFISQDGRSLCDALLTVDPEQRISLDDAIQHPWFESVKRGEAHEDMLPAQTVQALRKFNCTNRLKRRACRLLARNVIDMSMEPQLDWIR